MDFEGFEIFCDSSPLPALDSPWVSLELDDGTYNFKRSKNLSRAFSISGWIQKATLAETRTEAEGLNQALISNPSGTYTNGFGTPTYVIVESWEIAPIPGVNKYTFSMSLRQVVSI